MQAQRHGYRGGFLGLGGVLLAQALASAQPAGGGGAGGPGGPGAREKETAPVKDAAPVQNMQTQLPPGIQAAVALGAHIRGTTYLRPVLPVVVIADSPRAYAAAVSAWRLEGMYPVLIDDGTFTARENIARFVRAYAPTSVLRYSAPQDFPLGEKAGGETDEKTLKRIVQLAGASAAHVPPMALLAAGAQGAPAAGGGEDAKAGASSEARLAPFVNALLKPAPDAGIAALQSRRAALSPGIVVTALADPAWTGALALAAAHGEALRFIVSPAKADMTAAFDLAEARALQATILEAANPPGTAGARWEERPYPIAGLTLALTLPVRVNLTAAQYHTMNVPPGLNPKEGEAVALTDLIARYPSGARVNQRFALGAQLMGSASASAYRAMGAIFLPGQTVSARGFEGYDGTGPFGLFSMKLAESTLKANAWTTNANAANQRTLEDWRMGIGGPLAAGLVLMNSSGLAYNFDLVRGMGCAGDIPILGVPAAAHVVHSWSATNPENRWTVGGRWLDRGCYAYVGSVHEPYLGAFVPTPMLVNRLLIGMPLGAAARVDDFPMWRITVLGDPLVTFGPGRVPRLKAGVELVLKGEDVMAGVAGALKAKDAAALLRLLPVVGRDADAARLAGALAREDAKKIPEDAAPALVGCAFRAGDVEALCALYPLVAGRVTAERLDDLPDMLWQMLYARRGMLTDAQVELLGANLRRGDTYVRDAGDVASILAARKGKGAASAYLVGVRSGEKDANLLPKLDELIRAYSGR
ncbi:hypothetical protein BH11PLA1_BH11PLA1_17440 [soil metagenome]